MDGGNVGVGVSGVNFIGVCGGVRSEGCTNGSSNVPELDAFLVSVPVPASKLVLRSSAEGLGECTAMSQDEPRGRSMSSRGTAYPSRATSTVSYDLKVPVPPGPKEAPTEAVRPERTRLAVRVTLVSREGPELFRADSRTDFRRCRSASSQRLSVCSSPKEKKTSVCARRMRTATRMLMYTRMPSTE